MYAYGTADAFPVNSDYSVHTERQGFVPVVAVGGRFAVDERWSTTIEYRLVGHYRVHQALLGLQYSLSR